MYYLNGHFLNKNLLKVLFIEVVCKLPTQKSFTEFFFKFNRKLKFLVTFTKLIEVIIKSKSRLSMFKGHS